LLQRAAGVSRVLERFMPVSPFRWWPLWTLLGAAPSDEYAKHLTALREHLCTVNVLEAVQAAKEARKLRPDASMERSRPD
jgi:hypothetical protein